MTIHTIMTDFKGVSSKDNSYDNPGFTSSTAISVIPEK